MNIIFKKHAGGELVYIRWQTNGWQTCWVANQLLSGGEPSGGESAWWQKDLIPFFTVRLGVKQVSKVLDLCQRRHLL